MSTAFRHSIRLAHDALSAAWRFKRTPASDSPIEQPAAEHFANQTVISSVLNGRDLINEHGS